MTADHDGRSPRSGDRVRATTDDRDAHPVEGVLHIRYIPSLDYVQVNVLDDRRAWSVTVESIELLQPEAVPAADLEQADPVTADPAWRRISDVAEACQSGLLRSPRLREGGTWSDMFDELARRAQPLLDAGWRLVSTDRDESSEYGDSVFYDLERDGCRVELEYYEHGELVGYSLDYERTDEEDSTSLFSLPESTIESALAQFEAQGWR